MFQPPNLVAVGMETTVMAYTKFPVTEMIDALMCENSQEESDRDERESVVWNDN